MAALLIKVSSAKEMVAMLECCACHGMLRNPYQGECLHRVCFTCYLERNGCPKCFRQYNPREDPLIAAILNIYPKKVRCGAFVVSGTEEHEDSCLQCCKAEKDAKTRQLQSAQLRLLILNRELKMDMKCQFVFSGDDNFRGYVHPHTDLVRVRCGAFVVSGTSEHEDSCLQCCKIEIQVKKSELLTTETKISLLEREINLVEARKNDPPAARKRARFYAALSGNNS